MPQMCSAATLFKTIHAFSGRDGSSPTGEPIFDADGNLYGTTLGGGAYAGGTVFKLTHQLDGSWTETIIYSFCARTNCSDGQAPVGTLIFDGAGDLYGVAATGGDHDGGVAFSLTPSLDGSWTEKVLYSFCFLTNCVDGWTPLGGLVLDQAGNLYGITAGGGFLPCNNSSGCGVAFELTPKPDGSWAENVLYKFCSLTNCADGSIPQGRLVFDQAGNLYGTTIGGGLFPCNGVGCGVVFQLRSKPDGTRKEKVLHQFRGGADGCNPIAGVILDGAGDLFGTTFSGYQCGAGTVFELMPKRRGAWRGKIIHTFGIGNDGTSPEAPLAIDENGNLFGTTFGGGDYKNCPVFGCGLVFKLTPQSDGRWFGKIVHRFHDHPGAGAAGGVVLDATGNLYGTTGGLNSSGSAYEIIP